MLVPEQKPLTVIEQDVRQVDDVDVRRYHVANVKLMIEAIYGLCLQALSPILASPEATEEASQVVHAVKLNQLGFFAKRFCVFKSQILPESTILREAFLNLVLASWPFL